ncbi:MAG: methyltransferase [bacterium]|nr:methyltransferase [bacterium]
MKISDEVLQVLNNSKIENNLLFLPPNLDRKLYLKVNDALISIGLIWNKKQKCHVSETDIEDKLEEIINTGEYDSLKEKKKELNFFETPQHTAEAMVKIADVRGLNCEVLEPSCGKGRIVKEIMVKTPNITIIEIDKENYNYTLNAFPCVGYKENGNVDFLSVAPEEIFDRIIMNPPFSKSREILHILHTWKFLKSGGILVSVCSLSPFFRNNQKSIDFRTFLEDNDAEIIDLPEGSFKESGTNIRTKLIKIKK